MRVTPEEQVSALLDGELEGRESELLLRRVAKDDGLRATALRYCLIGDAMRDELPGRAPADLVERVRAGLAEAGAPSRPARPWGRYFVGAGVAASVALVALVSLPGSDPEAPAPVPLSSTEVAAPAVAPAYTVPPVYTRPASGGPNRLTRYYINHSEYATLMGGRSALSRIVVRSPKSPESPEGEASPDVQPVNAPQ